ncbi:hypothetical protein [Nocardia sp. CA-119907]|uniref:hypothetical protein n=1 Tax=Nocardia sp. CA-119907 TaxID=3239973 RepID=UPI003D976564
MPDYEVDAGVLRRQFVAIATSVYAHDLPPLPGVAEEVATLAGWLCAAELGRRRFDQPHPHLARNPSEDAIRAAIRTPPRPWTDSDAVALFVTGHGLVSSGSHWIALEDTDPSRPITSAIRTADLIGWITEHRPGVDHLLAVFDMCHAGATAADAVRFEVEFPPTWVVLASTTKDRTARTGALTAAIAGFLQDLASPQGRRFGNESHLKVGDFLEQVQLRLRRAGQRLAFLSSPDLATRSPCLPNPHHRPDDAAPTRPARRELALRAEDVRSHWGPRSRGVAAQDDPGWLFTGRARLMRQLIEATEAPPHTTLVTGSAGSGKSAVLARLVTLADPAFTAAYATRVAAIPADLRPAPEAVDVAVLATGKLPHEVLAQICDACGVEPPGTAAPTLAELRTVWWSWVSLRRDPVTIVVDALDEAADPHSLLDDVLVHLEPPETTRRVRLVIGIRSPGGDEVTSGPVLADLAEVKLRAIRLRVDRSPLWIHTDLVDYVADLLHTTKGSPYRSAPPAVVATVARIIAAKAGTSYLVARLAAGSLAARAEVIDPADPSWAAALDDGVVGVFRDDLHTSLADPRDRERVVYLLGAVAFAYGRGSPWYKIWPLVANAVADHPERTYGDGDIAWLLDSRLSGYLVTDTEDDTTVYRLFHDALRDTLRRRRHDLLATTTRTNGDDRVAAEARIAHALTPLARVREYDGHPVPPPAYVRRHLVEHAHAGRVLDDHTIPAQFLPYLDLARLRKVLGTVDAAERAGAAGLTFLPVLSKSSHAWDWHHPTVNAATLTLWAALTDTPVPAHFGGPWQFRWVAYPPDPSEIVGRHIGRIQVAASATLADGRVVALTLTEYDVSVQVWDLATATPAGPPLPGTGGVLSMATATLPDGRVAAVTGCGDNTIRVWDIATATLLRELPTDNIYGVRSVATAALPDGPVVAITANGDEVLQVWDLTTGVPDCRLLTRPARYGSALATATLPDGRVVALTGGDDRALRVWDLATGTALGVLGKGISTFATATLPDGRVVAVTRGYDATVRVWDLASADPIGKPLTSRARDGVGTRSVGAIATATLPDRRVVAITGGDYDTIWVWDLTTQTGRPITGRHIHDVESLVTATLPDGRAVMVTGGYNGILRMWDLATVTAPQRRPRNVRLADVEVVATATLPDRRAVVVTLGSDHTMRVSDLTTGRLIRSLTDAGSVGAVATAVLPDGRTFAVTASSDMLSMWDVATGLRIGQPMTGSDAVDAVATAVLPDGRVLAVAIGDYDTVRAWDLTAGLPVGEPMMHDDGVLAAATATLPNGPTVAVTGGYDGILRMWDLTTATPLGRPMSENHAGEVGTLATTTLPDGRVVAVAGYGSGDVRMWDLTTCLPVGKPMTGHTRWLTAVATVTLPDQRVVAVTGGYDATVRIWDLTTTTPIDGHLTIPSARITSITGYHLDGPGVIIASEQVTAAIDLVPLSADNTTEFNTAAPPDTARQ